MAGEKKRRGREAQPTIKYETSDPPAMEVIYATSQQDREKQTKARQSKQRKTASDSSFAQGFKSHGEFVKATDSAYDDAEKEAQRIARSCGGQLMPGITTQGGCISSRTRWETSLWIGKRTRPTVQSFWNRLTSTTRKK
jgi:hypothetical protein